MDLQTSIARTVDQFTWLNQVGINCVNKGATSLESFREDVREWMKDHIPEE